MQNDKHEPAVGAKAADQDSQAKGEALTTPGKPQPEDAAAAPPAKDEAKGRAPKAAKTKPPARRSGFRWGSFLFGLLILAGLGALAWYQWQHQQQFEARLASIDESVQSQLDSELAGVSSALNQLRAEARTILQQAREQAEAGNQQNRQLQQQLRNQVEEQARAMQEQAQALEAQVRSLRQQVQAISTTTTEDWKLAEAYYLTRLAGQRLLMERDMGSALALMQAADRIVRDYPDPELFPVREALAQDIAELKVAQGVDREGVYLQLASLGQQIDQLPVAEPEDFQPATGSSEPATEGSEEEARGWWAAIQRSFAKALDQLQGYVRISQHDQPPEPLMSPDRQLYLRSSLHTALDTAQLALLREQPEIYRQSLEKVRAVMNQLFTDSKERSNLLAELDQLAALDITQPLPNISESQQALGDYLERRHRLAPAAGPNNGAQP